VLTIAPALEHYQSGDLAGAERLCIGILQRAPDHVDALNLLGVIHGQRGRHDRAVELLTQAAALDRDNADILSNLGNVLKSLARAEEAEGCYRRAIDLRPDAANTYNNLGSALRDWGRFEEAERALRRALELDPGHTDAHNNLGALLQDVGRGAEAERHYRCALELKPDYAEGYCNLGSLLLSHGRLAEAAACLRRAIELKPDYPQAHNNLGGVYKKAGELHEAAASYRRAVELKPEYDTAHSNLIFTLDMMQGTDLAQQQAERRRWHESHARKFALPPRAHANRRDAAKRLRVGYVSADFMRHSAFYSFAPLIVLHDRAGFDVYCYSGVKREDDATERLKKAAGAWRSTLGTSDDALAEQIRADGIDILVDLSGHSAGNRLLVFARKPAPVQVTAWGHATGTGLAAMDYFFSDRIAVPEEVRGLFAEEVIDLPCALCYEPPEYLPEIAPLPALAGKPITYGCVNRLEKITDQAVALWGRILEGAPETRMLVKDKNFDDAQVRERFLGRLRNAGINIERVVLAGASPHAQHLKIFAQIDVGLDPFPQGGGISTAEALWMGVPVVTLMGRTPPSRYTHSILGQVGLSDWVATSEDEYVRIALQAARDLPRVARIRAELRDRLRASPFGDLRAYTRAVEQTYRDLWRRWCELHQ
jgi:predicted O-linked N-acetylglucosamine transferase (SPINDLY family)